MDLFTYTIVTSLGLLLAGFTFALNKDAWNKYILSFPRSTKLSLLFMGLSLLWFLVGHVSNLSEADFGEYKILIGTIGVGIAVGAFFYVNDFLAVRGLSMLLLFYSREVLDSAFLHESQSRLLLVSIIYLIIVLSLYLGAWPYRIRDFFTWIFDQANRSRNFGVLLILLGVVLGVSTFAY